MEENSGDFSDELDEFEESIDETKQRGAFAANNRNQTTYSDKPYDEAYEISQDLSMAESYDGRDKNQAHITKIMYYYQYLQTFYYSMRRKES